MSAAVDRFREVLKQYVGTEELVEVYEDREDTDKFEVGFVLSVSEDYYSLALIDSKGRPNGSFVGQIDEIVRLAVGTQYLVAIKLLHERQRQTEFPVRPTTVGPFETLLDLVRYARNSRIMVSVTADVQFLGFIKDYTDDHIELLEVNKSGIEDGIHYIDLEEVVRIDFDGPSEEARLFLHRVRMGL
ncbi:MAG: hypothetical protein JST12_00100 [Armatimonadetes bacterium]|nr:hypothetical protein [Armatimonadota bacterium]MBS1726824.1 hypothetical protein [Armatimonadota bacterium]